MYNMNVNERALWNYSFINWMGEVRCYVSSEKSSIPMEIESALDLAVITYIQLSNAGMKAQLNCPVIIF